MPCDTGFVVHHFISAVRSDTGFVVHHFTSAVRSDTMQEGNDSNTSESYYYDYDYTLSISSIPLAELIPVTLVYGVTFILGITGNSLVIFSIARYRRMKNITNTFLLSLAIADVLLVALCVPIKVRRDTGCIQIYLKIQAK